MVQPFIESLYPSAGIEGGEVIIQCRDCNFSSFNQIHIQFNIVDSRPIGASQTRAIVPIPSSKLLESGAVKVSLQTNSHRSNGVDFIIGKKLAENLHPVANPAYDRDNGAIYTTLSGTRGQNVPVSVYKITPDGESEPFLTDIVNPTGLALNPDGEMFITSRYDGNVYKVTPFKESEVFARNLGTATGIAFNQEGKMFVGDRSGTIFLVNEIGESSTFATLEPSMAAYHLAFGPDHFLYVTGPNISSFDSVLRISPDGEVSRFFTGLGRPQGMAFDNAGNLYVAASRQGHRGVVKITPDAEAELVVAGAGIVGLCFNDQGDMILATNREIFRVPLSIIGYSPF
jgi:sugar lactone lactonase YvrE